MAMKRVLVVNPNANPATTELLVARARQAFATFGVGEHVEVEGLTNSAAATMISTLEELAAAEASTYAVVNKRLGAETDARGTVLADADAPGPEPVDAVVIGAFGDPGLDALVQAYGEAMPVVGIGMASILAATEWATGEEPYDIVTTTADLEPALRKLVGRWDPRGDAAPVSVRLFPATQQDVQERPEVVREGLEAVTRQALQAGARRVIIGGGPLSGFAQQLAGQFPDQIVEPVAAACELLLQRW